MDKNEKRRQAYAQMDRHKKEAMLKRRREQYAAKKATEGRQVTGGTLSIGGDAIGSSSQFLNEDNCPSNISSSSNRDETSEVSQDSTSMLVHVENDSVRSDVTHQRRRSSCSSRRPSTRAHIDVILYLTGPPDAMVLDKENCLRNYYARKFSLPPVADCQYCHAKRFHLEPPSFCCSQGQISLAFTEMPNNLARLYTDHDEDSIEFQKFVRTYNNNLAFTTFYAKTDAALLQNTKGVYTFKVQGKVHHFLTDLTQNRERPSGLQLYFYDTDVEISRRLEQSPRFRHSIMYQLVEILATNPYTVFFKQVKDLDNVENYKILLTMNPSLDQRTHNLPTTSDVSAIITADDDYDSESRCHIQIYTRSSTPHKISHTYACYDPLQYPLLFPRGESGWHPGIQKLLRSERKRSRCRVPLPTLSNVARRPSDLVATEEAVAKEGNGKTNTVSCREYYCYKIQIRAEDKSMLIHTGRLFQQYVVDMYVKIESLRLDFHKKNQKEKMMEYLQEVIDSLASGHRTGSKVGKKYILPPSFVGGPKKTFGEII